MLFAAINDKKISHRDNEGKSAFQTTAIELHKQPKKTNKKRTNKISNELLHCFVLSTMKIYSYFSFVPKKVELLKISEMTQDFENRYQHVKMVEKKKINFSVSPYCTLLFSRKENNKFSEVALVAVHCNCLISDLMIA